MPASRVPQLFPVGDRVIVRPQELPDKIGSIHIPQQARGKSNEGTVIAVGPGRREASSVGPGGYARIPLSLNVGDSVYFGRFAGVEIEVDGEKLLVLREDEILTQIK